MSHQLTYPLLPATRLCLHSNIKTLVLDEADEMLNKGFKEQIYDIYRYLPPETQVQYSSAAAASSTAQQAQRACRAACRCNFSGLQGCNTGRGGYRQALLIVAARCTSLDSSWNTTQVQHQNTD
jgi:hypothetical protein